MGKSLLIRCANRGKHSLIGLDFLRKQTTESEGARVLFAWDWMF
jgi:hypothetical protein